VLVQSFKEAGEIKLLALGDNLDSTWIIVRSAAANPRSAVNTEVTECLLTVTQIENIVRVNRRLVDELLH
jgi:hypothetical protein